MTNTTVYKCLLGIELVEGLPVAAVYTNYRGGIDFRGTVVGFKENEMSTSVKVAVVQGDGSIKIRTVRMSKIVTDAKAIMEGKS